MPKTLNKRELRALEAQLAEYGVHFHKQDRVVLIDDTHVAVNGSVAFFFHEGRLIPSLRTLLKTPFLPSFSVDRGAIPHIIKGADVMRPGVVAWDKNIFKGGIISIVDQEYRKPLAVAEALVPSDELGGLAKGKVAKTLHYVGDQIWNLG